MGRISLAFRAFFALLFGGELHDDLITALGLRRKSAATPPPPKPTAAPQAIDGAVQILSILQRDSRIIDFLMEDITSYTDEQIGGAVRSMHDDCRDSLKRYVALEPVVDGVEGTFTKPGTTDPSHVKYVGNVKADTAGGVLVHKGWRATRVDLPVRAGKQDAMIIAPAELEVE